MRINYPYIPVREDIHYYSVPYRLKGNKLKVIYTSTSVEIYYDGKRIASHRRDRKRGGYTTNKDHMPSAHRYYAGWSPDRIIRWAAKVGPCVKKLVSIILSGKQYPEQAYRTCIGIINLARKYEERRVDMACKRALSFKLYKYKSSKKYPGQGSG